MLSVVRPCGAPHEDALTHEVSRVDAVAQVQAQGLHALSKRPELGEAVPGLLSVEFQAP